MPGMSKRSAVPFIAIGTADQPKRSAFSRRRVHVWPETGAYAPHPIGLPWYLPEMDFSV
jgi:hypothetical protein